MSLFCFLLNSCKESNDYKEAIYITGIENSDKVNLVADGPTSLAITASTSFKTDKNLEVSFEVHPELLENFNEKTGKKCIIPPTESYNLENSKVIIKQGSNISSPVKLSILSLDDFKEGNSYCIPVSIKKVSGGVSVLESSRTIFVTISKSVTTKAAKFFGNDLCVEKFQTDPSVKNLGAITMECSFKVDRFSWINSIMGIEENFLMRCVDWDNDGNYNFEMGPIMVGGKKYFHAANSNLIPGKWYHVAIVSDGSKTSLYINGKLDSEVSGRSGNVDLSVVSPFYFGTSCNARPLNGAISEARIWSRVLSVAEIQENICYVDPASNGLLAYWRFNEVQPDGSVVDLSGHGFNAVQPRWGKITFEENVKCPF